MSTPTGSHRYLVDSNVLLRFIEAGHTQHQDARNALLGLDQTGALLHLVPQVLIEFWGVATRPSSARGGLNLSPARAEIEVARFQAGLILLLDAPGIFPEWERLASSYGVSGKEVHDTRLVAAMKVHGLTHLLTFNGKDFRRFEQSEGITAVDPATVTAPGAST